MSRIDAVYLDLRDQRSARVWRWLRLLGMGEEVEVRPFSLEVADPWECHAPPFGLELLMLLEQARGHGRVAMAQVVDAAVDRIRVAARSPVDELATWLEIGALAGLPLADYDEDMERLRAEVGYWQAEARDELGVSGPPALLLCDGSVVMVLLDDDVPDLAEARRLLRAVAPEPESVGSRRPPR